MKKIFIILISLLIANPAFAAPLKSPLHKLLKYFKNGEMIKIQSYNSKINVTKEQFIEFLIVNDFEPSSSKYFLSIQDNNYSNKKINSIYELYDFKRKLINSNLINPIRNDLSGSEDIIVNFTPIKLIEFYRENYLFPPKSTWISPRI